MKLRTLGPLSRTGDVWKISADEYLLCFDGLRRYFNIPEDAEKLWLEIHNRPAKDRLRVRLTGVPSRLRMGDYGRRGHFMYYVAWFTVFTLVGGDHTKSVYVEVHYQ